MHHGQSRGKNTSKVCKKQVNLPKKISESPKFFSNRGNSETEGENASWSQGGWTPLIISDREGFDRCCFFELIVKVLYYSFNLNISNTYWMTNRNPAAKRYK